MSAVRVRPIELDAVRRAAVSLGLVLVTLAALGGVRGHGFVNFDDDSYVTENPRVLRGLSAASVGWALTDASTPNWQPVTWLSHMLDVQAFGLDAGKHHRTSLWIHAANVVLLFLLLCRMTGALWRSAFVASLFALHPLHVESVAWIAERKDVLSTCFWLLAIAAWLSYLQSRTIRRYLAVLLLFALALMAKPMAVTLPFTLLLLDFWPLRRLAPGSKATPAIFAGLLLEKTPLFVLSAIAGAITLIGQSRAGAIGALDAFPLSERLANAIVAYAAYLGRTLWPSGLAVLYPWTHRDLLSLTVAACALLVAGVTAAAIGLRRRAPYLTFGWLWYMGTLVPVIGLVQVGAQSMADRYTYVPLVGIFVALAWGLADLAGESRPGRYGAAVAATASLVALGAATRVQVDTWTDSVTLCRHALAVTSGSSVMENNLGRALFDRGQTDDAMHHYAEALRIQPDYADARNNLGVALMKAGRSEEAIEALTQAMKSRPDDALSHFNLGTALAKAGRSRDAAAQLERALQLSPTYVAAHNSLGALLLEAGELDAAIEQFDAAARIDPEFYQAQYNLALALSQRGEPTRARAAYERTIKLAPRHVDARNNLAALLAAQGDLAGAKAQYEALLRIEPGYFPAQLSLGLIAIEEDDLAAAESHLGRALQLRPDSVEARRALEDFRRRAR